MESCTTAEKVFYQVDGSPVFFDKEMLFAASKESANELLFESSTACITKSVIGNKAVILKFITCEENDRVKIATVNRELIALEALCTKDHPNIMEYYGFGKFNSTIVMVFEFINGPTLKFWRANSKLDIYPIDCWKLRKCMILEILDGWINGNS